MKKTVSKVCGVLFAVHIGMLLIGLQNAFASSSGGDNFTGSFFVQEAQKHQADIDESSVKVARKIERRHSTGRANISPKIDLPMHEENAFGSSSGGLSELIAHHASESGVPLALAQAVVHVESNFNPRAAHAGNFGLMQIRFGTARSMGFSGTTSALLNSDTNLHYGMKYLAMLYHMAGGDVCRSLMYYQSGPGVRHANAANQSYCRKAKIYMAQNLHDL